MLSGDTVTRDVIAELIRNIVDETVRAQRARGAQEPVVTSKVAGRLEDRLHGMEVFGRRISVMAQEFTDRGPGAQEKRAGADLFIAIKVEDAEATISKGLLVQAKWWGGGKSKVEQGKLVTQCRDMLDRTTTAGAFVWLYGSDGVNVVPTIEILARPHHPPEIMSGRNVAQQFRDVLDCFQGDPAIAPTWVFESPEGLRGYMADIAVGTGIAINVGDILERTPAGASE